MKKNLLRLLTVILSLTMLITAVAVNSTAMTTDELRQNISELEAKSKKIEAEIKSLQGEIKEQKQLKAAIEEKIAVVQQQINLCNNEISKINSSIAANKAEIEEKNQEIEADKLKFKKRLRAIYMSNTGSDIQILLGAEDFSQFLQLAQLTSSVAARDKILIENLVSAIKELEAKQEENNKLLEEQVEIKKIVTQKQAELQSENSKIQSVINKIDSDQGELEASNAQIEKQIKSYNSTLASMTTTAGTSFVYDGGAFIWPTPGYYMITAGYHSNDPVHRGTHYGIDISGGGIAGARIVAIADGVVTRSFGGCPHNYAKYGSCGCGGGYGNYVTVNHGTNGGNTYVATYGHMSSIAVGAGTTVKKGQTIGYVGTTGWSTGYHLHFGLAVNGMWQNPMNYFRKVG